MIKHQSGVSWVAAAWMAWSGCAGAAEWERQFIITPQYRWFVNAPVHAGQGSGRASLALQAKLRRTWNDRRDSFDIIPFVRWDAGDAARSHFDVRDASWIHAGNGWESLLGISKVFWGVTESQHLVDIINQTDLVESPAEEEKLGQPMIKLTGFGQYGALDLFLLYRFRERTFPGRKGRLRGPLPFDDLAAQIERRSSDLDFALRWSHTFGDFDVAVSHFSGTGREPELRTTVTGAAPYLFYPMIGQTGLEAQATLGPWLWKAEAIHRTGGGQNHNAAVAGFEYTRFGIAQTAADLGLIGEYNYDSRGRSASTGLANDLFVATRWSANDTHDTTALVGLMFGLDADGHFLTLDGSRRIKNHMRLRIEGRHFFDPDVQDIFFDWRNDSYLQVSLEIYF